MNYRYVFNKTFPHAKSIEDIQVLLDLAMEEHQSADASARIEWTDPRQARFSVEQKSTGVVVRGVMTVQPTIVTLDGEASLPEHLKDFAPLAVAKIEEAIIGYLNTEQL